MTRGRSRAGSRVAPGTPRRERIAAHSTPDPATGCWVWRMTLDGNGYGRLTIDGKGGFYAHRVAYEEFVGPIPGDKQLDHLCRNRACCNPAHLEPVTPLVNTRRGTAHGVLATKCPQGHPYNADNTYRAHGRRYCRPCKSAYIAIYNAMTPVERAERKAAGLPIVDLAKHFTARLADTG